MTALTRTWLILVVLTIGSLIVGRATQEVSLGVWGVAAVLLASGFKAVQILRRFLDLREASFGWQAAFYGYLALIGAVIMGAYTFSQFK